MENSPKLKVHPFNPGESKMLKARVYDLTEIAAKQMLYGIVQALGLRASLSRTMFEEILDDTSKYSEIKKRG